jgi:site-specific recombinase XerD
VQSSSWWESAVSMKVGEAPDWTLSDALEAHLSYCVYRKLSTRTIESKEFSIGKFISYAEEYELPALRDLAQQHIQGYLTWFGERRRWNGERAAEDPTPVSASHVATQYRRLHAFFNWCVTSSSGPKLPSNPMTGLDKVVVEDRLIPDISDDVLQAVLSLTDYRNKRIAPTELQRFRVLRDRAAICFLIESPTRLNEINSLRAQDIMFDENQRGIPDVSTEVMGKGGKPRQIYFGKRTSSVLIEYLGERKKWARINTDALWVSAHSVKGGRMSNRWLWSMLSKLGQSIRTPEHRDGITLHPHMFRHRYALEWLRRGDPEYLLKEYAGWSEKIPDTYTKQIKAEDAQKIAVGQSPVDRLMGGR